MAIPKKKTDIKTWRYNKEISFIKIRQLLFVLLNDYDRATSVAVKVYRYLVTKFRKHELIDLDDFHDTVMGFIRHSTLEHPEVQLDPAEGIYETFKHPIYSQISTSISTEGNKRVPLVHRDIVYCSPTQVKFVGSFSHVANIDGLKIQELQEGGAPSTSGIKLGRKAAQVKFDGSFSHVANIDDSKIRDWDAPSTSGIKLGRKPRSKKKKVTKKTTVKGKKATNVKKRKSDNVKGTTDKAVKRSRKKSGGKKTPPEKISNPDLEDTLTKEQKKVEYDEIIKTYIQSNLGLRTRK